MPTAVAEAVLATHDAETGAKAEAIVGEVKHTAEAHVEEVKHTAEAYVGEAIKAKEQLTYEATSAVTARDLELHDLRHKFAMQQERARQASSEYKKMTDALQAQLLATQAESQEKDRVRQALIADGQNCH